MLIFCPDNLLDTKPFPRLGATQCDPYTVSVYLVAEINCLHIKPIKYIQIIYLQGELCAKSCLHTCLILSSLSRASVCLVKKLEFASPSLPSGGPRSPRCFGVGGADSNGPTDPSEQVLCPCSLASSFAASILASPAGPRCQPPLLAPS